MGGSVASVINIPFDVAKSRIQGFTPEGTPRKYHTCFQSILLVQKEEGTKALFKGLVPKIMRLGPGGAIMMIAYEEIYKYLKSTLWSFTLFPSFLLKKRETFNYSIQLVIILYGKKRFFLTLNVQYFATKL